MVIDGKKIAEGILEELKKRPKTKKFFAAFLVGENPASASFLAVKERTAKELGVDFRVYRFPEATTQDKLRKEVLKIAEHARCGGAIVQLPFPGSINAQYVLNAIPREKDIDVLGERALGAFYAGRNPVLPPAVGVVEAILGSKGVSLDGKKAAIIGLGSLVGKPISVWLEGKVKELYLLDKGSDLSVLKDADIVVCGAGVPQLVKPEMLKDGALIIDFGYGTIAGKTFGDFDAPQQTTNDKPLTTISYTPTPGGTGPVLVAKLFENFYELLGKE